MDLRLKGKKAIVTGGTRGIGRAIVERLMDEGAAVGFCARTESDVELTAKALSGRDLQVVGRALDVADGAALTGWVEDVAVQLGGLDIVVANVSAMAVPDQGEESWERSFSVDMMGTVRLVKTALPHLQRSEDAAVITISSASAREIDFAAGPYGAFKAALIHYTQGLAHQLAGAGIRANSISPGNVYFDGGVWQGIEQGDKAFFDHALAHNPTGRMGRPDEIANAAVFLASPAASFITATNLVVDGALTRGVQL